MDSLFEKNDGGKKNSERKLTQKDYDQVINKLEERVKEQACLYNISSLDIKELSEESVFSKIIENLQQAFQFPGLAEIAINYDNKLFISERYKKKKWDLVFSSENVEGNRLEVRVNYRNKPKTPEPFLPEEKLFLDTLTDLIAFKLSQKEVHHKRESEQNTLQKILNQSLDVICTINEKGEFVKVSEASKQVWGYNSDELVGKLYMDMVHPDDHELTKRVSEEIISGKEFTNFQNRYLRKDGSVVDIVWSARWDSDDRLMYCIAKDATELNRAKLEMELLINNTDESFVLLDKDLKIVSFNRQFEKLCSEYMGITMKKGDYIIDHTPSEKREEVKKRYERVLEGEVEESTLTFIEPDGDEKIFSLRHQPAKNEYFEIIGAFVTSVDVTREFQIRRELEQSNERYQYVTQATSDAIWDFSPKTGDLFWGEGFKTLFGYERGMIKGVERWMDNIHPEDIDRINNSVSKLLSGKESNWDQEYRFKKADENYAYVRDKAVVVLDESGKPERVIGAMEDVTHQVEARENLKVSKERFEYALKASNDVIYDHDMVADTIALSDNFQRIFGYSFADEEFTLEKWGKLLHPDDVEKIDSRLNKTLADKKKNKWEAEFRYARNDGTYVNVKENAYIIRDDSGQAIRMIGTVKDVTESKFNELKKELSSNISQIFNDSKGVAEALKRSLLELIKVEDFKLAEVWLLNHNKDSIELIASLSNELKEFYSEADGVVSFQSGEGLPGKTWESGAFQFWKRVDNSKDFIRRTAAQKAGIKTGYGIPVTFGDEFLGALILGHAGVNQKPYIHTDILQEIAVQLGGEIYRKALEEELARIYTSAPDGIIVAGFDGYLKKVNPAFCEMLGYSEKELLTTPFIDFVHPDDLESTLKAYEDENSGVGKSYFENRYVKKSGKVVWISWSIKVFPEEEIAYSVAKDITEQKKIEELLDQANRLAKIGSWELDLTTNELYWTDITREIHEEELGFKPTLEDGLNYYKEGESRERIQQAVEEAIEYGTPWDLELKIVTAKGNERWVRAIGEAEHLDGQCKRIYGSFQDIDQRKSAEIALQEAFDEKNEILESIGDAFFALDNDWTVTYWNNVAESELGKSRDEMIGENLWEQYEDATDLEFYKQYHKAVREQVTVNFEEYYPVLEKWFDVTAYPSASGLSVYFKDVTERKRSQEEVLEKTRQLDAIAMFNSLLLKSDSWMEALEVSLQTFGEVVEADRVYFFENRFSDSGEPVATTMRIEWVKGSVKPEIDNPAHQSHPLSNIQSFVDVLVTKKVYNYKVDEIPDEQFKAFLQEQEILSLLALPVFTGKKFRGFIGFDDCTRSRTWREEEVSFLKTIAINLGSAIENEDTEEALEEAFSEKNEILESIGDGFFTVDENFTVTYWNNRAEELLFTSKEKILNQHLWDVFSKEMAVTSYENYSRALKERIGLKFEDYYEPIDRWFDVNVYPSLAGISVFFKDISERKKADERLKELNQALEGQTKALAASNAELEQFAFVASHDLQEPLRMITGFLAQLERKYEDVLDEKGRKYIHFATDGAKRMRQIILDLLEYSRVGRVDTEKTSVDTSEILDDVMILNRKLIADKKASVTWGEMPEIYAARAPIQQLFQNLVNNALTYQRPGKKPVVKISAEDQGSHWKFSVQDNGIGINPEYTDKIFNIFQRLHGKEEYSGTGVGLAICKKIVGDHGGEIGVDSSEGEGSTFYFSLAKKQSELKNEE
jgi:PAS domain S-box-containing protein